MKASILLIVDSRAAMPSAGTWPSGVAREKPSVATQTLSPLICAG